MGPMPSDSVQVAYPIQETTLDNGLRVIVSPDHTAPVVAVNIWYDVGSRDERPGQTGLAHLFEHLMFQGSANVASGEHISSMQAIGGAVNATTWFDRTNYFEAVPTGALELALWLEADRLTTLGDSLTEEDLDNQRDVVKEERRQRYDNVPYGDVLEHLVHMAFPQGHHYGHTTIGSMADLDAVTLTDAREFFETHYQPATAVLTLAGDVTVDLGYELAARFFGGITKASRAARCPAEALPRLLREAPFEVSGRVPADAVYSVWRLPAFGDPTLLALEVAAEILGGGQNSRLHRALVRDQQIAAGVGASVLPLAGGNSLALSYVSGLPNSDADALGPALTAEVESLLAGVTAAEFGRALAVLEREWLMELASVADRADRLGEFATLLGDPGHVNRRLTDLRALTPEAVQAAARDWLDPAHTATLYYRRNQA